MVDGVDVDGDGDSVSAGDFGGAGNGGGVVAINVEETGTGDHFGTDLFGFEAQAIGAAPEDGAFAGGLIDDDIGGLVGTIPSDLDIVEVYSGAEEAVPLDAATLVVAHRSDVFYAQAEFSAGDHGAGDLASGREHFFDERFFAGVGREFGNQQEGVGRIEADTDHIKF